METQEPTAAPAAAGSPLASLRARREQATKKLHLDLRVPRYDPPVVVRFKPLTQAVLDIGNKRAAELAAKKDPDATVIGNAVALTHACVGVYDELPDGTLRSIDQTDGTAPRFDDQLRELLELPEGSTGVEVVRALYLTDGDIIAAAEDLASWSARSERRIAEDVEGN